MFTGIIRHQGSILSTTPQEDKSVVLVLQAPFSHELSEGDSVAVNGACLTVLSSTNTTWTCRLMAETLAKTTLGSLKAKDVVNLEQPATAGDLLHGHVVQGHVDGVGTITDITPVGDDRVIRFQTSSEIMKRIVSKGSITLDGVSLTVVDVVEDSFTVSLMPYTLSHTTLGKNQVGDRVNIETDKGKPTVWFSGIVVRGEGRGKALGFPTANIKLDPSSVFTEEGIFACRVLLENDPTLYAGALHAGPRPTFPDSPSSVEIHLLHFPDQDIYGQQIRFTVIEKIRDTKKFESLKDLTSAITKDVENIAAILMNR